MDSWVVSKKTEKVGYSDRTPASAKVIHSRKWREPKELYRERGKVRQQRKVRTKSQMALNVLIRD